jgi:hypothetical protein
VVDGLGPGGADDDGIGNCAHPLTVAARIPTDDRQPQTTTGVIALAGDAGPRRFDRNLVGRSALELTDVARAEQSTR